MKMRLALKICRAYYDPLRYRRTSRGIHCSLRQRGKWKPHTIRSAVAFGNSHWRDHRYPYIPSLDEQLETHGIIMGTLIDSFEPDQELANQKKCKMWTLIDKELESST